jgi:hypothetical protein
MSERNIPNNAARRSGTRVADNPGQVGRFEVRRLLGEVALARLLGFDTDLER